MYRYMKSKYKRVYSGLVDCGVMTTSIFRKYYTVCSSIKIHSLMQYVCELLSFGCVYEGVTAYYHDNPEVFARLPWHLHIFKTALLL
jgi:hypothetical protein